MLANEVRLGILFYLQGQERAVSDIASHLELAVERVSDHLRLLLRAEVVALRVEGRRHLYGLSTPRLRRVLAALDEAVSLGVPAKAGRWQARLRIETAPRLPDMRKARLCFDHLGGGAGVYLLEELLRRRWVSVADVALRPAYELTPRGRIQLLRRGVKPMRATLPALFGRRLLAYGCPEWVPGRFHLGGGLAAIILETLVAQRILRLAGRSRSVVLRRPLAQWLDQPKRMRVTVRHLDDR